MNWNLVVHPQAARSPRHHVGVSVLGPLRATADFWDLTYEVSGATAVRWPLVQFPRGQRRDQLWTTTCFEMFVQRGSEAAYVEWNFSPSLHWACYEFSAYREPAVTALPKVVEPPRLEIQQLGDVLTMKVLVRNPICNPIHNRNGTGPPSEVNSPPTEKGTPRALGFTAVIEELDGQKFYWSLQHSTPTADFHRLENWSARFDGSESTIQDRP
jgi:hypothetical protein